MQLLFQKRIVLSLLVFLSFASEVTAASVFDIFGLGRSRDTNSLSGDLTQGEMVKGLKEALSLGVEQAIARLGVDGGFLTNLAVRIPMPEKLRSVEKTLRAMRQDKLADEFVVTMNRAAEKAVPEAAQVFTDALQRMSIDDAKSILRGGDDTATQFFRRTSSTNLFQRFLPIVKKATEQTGVVASYKKIMDKASRPESLGGFGKILDEVLGGPASFDVDSYVTDKAMDGLFKMVAEEEKRIRENPWARGSQLLKKVFGSIKR